MNPRSAVIALVTVITAVTGYTVAQNFGDLLVDPSYSMVSGQGR